LFFVLGERECYQVLKAVLFDLDGTLLQINAGEFMKEYLKEIAAAAAPVVEPGRFVRELLASTNAMMQNREQGQTNSAVFWADFHGRLGERVEDLKPLLEDFYAHRFNNLSRVAMPGGKAGQTVQKTRELGLRIVLATDPLFPESAIRDRMNWAGVGDLPWELVTSYEFMHFCKPHPEYYLEIASRTKLKPEHCLMVGNDVEKDIVPAAAAGMRTYLVTDFLINNKPVDSPAEGAGSLSGFVEWLTAIMRD